MSIVLLGSVAVMGGINVLKKLPSGLTAIDMALAALLLAELILLSVKVNHKDWENAADRISLDESKRLAHKRLMNPAIAAVAAIYSEILAGGFFKHSSASYTYVHPNAPLPNELVTRFATAELVMYIHMFSGFFVVMSLFWLFVHAKRQKLFVKQSVILLVLTGVQGFLGFFSLVTKLELLTTTAHMAVASLMFMIGVYVAANLQTVLAGTCRTAQSEALVSNVRTILSNG